MSVLELHARHRPELFDPALEPLLFWSDEVFSNFAASPLRLPHPHTGEPVAYATVEHYFQACKATTAEDHDWVRSAPTPLSAKRRGSRRGERQPDGTWRRITLRADWEHSRRYSAMLEALRKKFMHEPFRAELLATGRRYIAEDSPYDDQWGWRDKHGGRNGRNLLGLALMRVRYELAASESPAETQEPPTVGI